MITDRERYVHQMRIPSSVEAPPRVRRDFRRRIRAAIRWLGMAFRRARRRARLRCDLERFDEHLLRDIGARRLDLEAEAAKPFWRR